MLPQPVSTHFEFGPAVGERTFPFLHGLGMPETDGREKIPSHSASPPPHSWAPVYSAVATSHCWRPCKQASCSPEGVLWQVQLWKLAWLQEKEGLVYAASLLISKSTQRESILTGTSCSASSEQAEWLSWVYDITFLCVLSLSIN